MRSLLGPRLCPSRCPLHSAHAFSCCQGWECSSLCNQSLPEICIPERRCWERAHYITPSFVCLLQLQLGFGNKQKIENCPFFSSTTVREQPGAEGNLPVTVPCLAPGAAGAGEQSWEHPGPGGSARLADITWELPGNYRTREPRLRALPGKRHYKFTANPRAHPRNTFAFLHAFIPQDPLRERCCVSMYKALLFPAEFCCTGWGEPTKRFLSRTRRFWEKAQHGCSGAKVFVDPYGAVVYSHVRGKLNPVSGVIPPVDPSARGKAGKAPSAPGGTPGMG